MGFCGPAPGSDPLEADSFYQLCRSSYPCHLDVGLEFLELGGITSDHQSIAKFSAYAARSGCAATVGLLCRSGKPGHKPVPAGLRNHIEPSDVRRSFAQTRVLIIS